MQALTKFAVALGAFAIVMLASAFACAHTIGVSQGEYAVHGELVVATLVFRADELHLAATAAEVAGDTIILADGKRCDGKLASSKPDAPDGIRIVIDYACGHRPTHIRVHAGFLERLPGGHGHVVTLVDEAGRRSGSRLAVLASPDIDADIDALPPPGFLGFIRAGIAHILTGPDHLLFLLGLVLLRRDAATTNRERIRALVFVLTAFTIGHSISLAIATLGGIAPSARVVEPAVALSVAYVGAENLVAKASALKRRWLITLPFGLVHGFAFASGLLIVGLPRRELPGALVGFNVGVELGQIGVMLLVLPGLLLLARRARAYDVVRAVLSVGVAIAGLFWFVERVLG